MTALQVLAVLGHALLLLVAPIYVVGIINRVKSRWGGRVGPALNQSFFDLVRLLRKRPVQSRVASWFVQLGPLVLLATTLVAGCLTPLVGGWAPVAFDYDFVAFAYLLGLGRLLLLDALERIVGAADSIGIHAIEVWAKDEQTKGFYAKYGFVPLVDDPLHLYLAINTVLALGLV